MGVWLISGCSSGIGESIANAVLANGHQAVVTCRGDANKRLAHLVKAGAVALSLDVTASQDVIDHTVVEAVKAFGQIDVLVNNAGYVLQGVCEELTDSNERFQHETNVFGVFKLTRAVLKHFRKQRDGVIYNLALEGYSESLYHEVRPFGISVCVLELGDFRTSFADVLEGSAVKLPAAERAISDYDDIRSSLVVYNEDTNGKQRGDLASAASLMVKLFDDKANTPLPLRLALGSDAAHNIKQTYLEGLSKWQSVSQSTDFPGMPPVV